MSQANQELQAGTIFVSQSGNRQGEVGSLLGAGGQGAVYSVRLDGGDFALKWYHTQYVEIDTNLFERLPSAVARGAPDPRFLWPLELVRIPGHPSFGYIMPIRGAEYVGMKDLIAPPPKRVNLSLAARARVCRHIAHCFLQLHANGFCYQDINFGNIFLHPLSANILVCDNDNVNIDGAPASIYGTRKFMAPEVVRRETLPCTKTDLFSMAVMFFYVLFGWHPLDGRAEAAIKILSADAEMRLYGTEPVFIFDPSNTSNGPLEGMHDALVYRWRSISQELCELFTRAFTNGMFSPGQRIHEYQWRSAFDVLAAGSVACHSCGYENFLPLQQNHVECAYCGNKTEPLAVLSINKRQVVLHPGRIVETCAIENEARGDTAFAEVTVHPQKADVIGLKNLSQQIWRAQMPGYSATPLEPGKTIRLVNGLSLDLDQGHAVVHCPEGEADVSI